MDQFGGMSDGVNISDVIEVIQQDEIGGAQGNDDIPVEIIDEMPRNPSLMLGNPASMAMQPMGIQNETPKPYIEIIEQPSTGIRFRYEIEGRSAGSIPGKHSKQDMKTFPTIRIVGYSGRMTVVVSCVTVEDNPRQKPRPHPHKLVGKQQCKNGVCRVDVKGENMTIPFPNLGIQCVRKKDVEASLTERERERVDPFNTGFAHKRSPSNFALNKVRLCFQGFIPKKENGRIQWMSLAPVVSVPILEKKATYTLDILKMSHYSATVAGGLEMILLCDKVPKEEIQIRFFEDHGDSLWEAFADFQPAHVHHQYAITFRTPKYDNQEITEPVKVKVQLKLRNKPEGGEPRDFEMLPLGTGRPAFWSLRKAFAKKKTDFSTLDKILFTETSLSSHLIPRTLRNIDEFNNNDLDLKRSQDKFSALRALNDLYNVRNSLECQNGDVEIKSTLGRLNSKKIETKKHLDLENNEISIISVKKPDQNRAKIIPSDSIENTNEIRNINLEKIDSNNESAKSDWFNNSEVCKWVQKGQEFQKSQESKLDNQTSKIVSEEDRQSLNELLSQVAELDQIYADTHTKLIENPLTNSNEKGIEIDVRDNMTYTSLQMAMKNPVELFDLSEDRNYDDVPVCSPIIAIAPPPLTTKRDVTSELDERLPPLPPKRIRKTPSMPVLPRLGSFQTPMETESSFGAPNKNLPSPPGTLPKQSKQGLFSKLFAKRQKKEKDSYVSPTTGSNRSLNVTGNISSLRNDELDVLQFPRPSMANVTSVRSLRLDCDDSHSYGMELSEAENYALYTAMAPHATASEFDEMSFYYSPVEGGKILTEVKEA